MLSGRLCRKRPVTESICREQPPIFLSVFLVSLQKAFKTPGIVSGWLLFLVNVMKLFAVRFLKWISRLPFSRKPFKVYCSQYSAARTVKFRRPGNASNVVLVADAVLLAPCLPGECDEVGCLLQVIVQSVSNQVVVSLYSWDRPSLYFLLLCYWAVTDCHATASSL